MGAEDLSGQVLHQTYRLERLLGEGGMGEVYVASHLRLERKFAIKLLIPEVAKDEVALGRFQREARITSALGHPHIVEVVDFNVAPDGRPYLVMELLEGQDLGRRIEQGGAMPLAQIASILRQVTSALQAAHEQGVVHRDLKPENVFLCRRGARDDYVKLLDFGISKVLGSKTVETMQRTLVGSPCYMSPEQADERTAEVDARTDVYAVGTMLYEMLAGGPPFHAASLPSLLYKIVHVDPPDMRQIRPDVPEPLVQVLGIAMHKDPDLRYQGMEELWLAFFEAVEAASGGVEKTEISHTAWPEQPELRVETTGQVAVPSGIKLLEGMGPSYLGRSTTLSVSAGELRPQGRRRRPWVPLAIGGVLLLASAAIFALLLHDREPRPVVAASGKPDTGLAQDALVLGEVLPDLAPASAPAAERPDARSPIAAQKPAATVAAPTPAPAWLQVAAVSGGKPVLANVFMDGRKVGQSPAVLRRVRPGRHVLEVRRFGQRGRMVVHLKSGQRRSVVLHLDRRQ